MLEIVSSVAAKIEESLGGKEEISLRDLLQSMEEFFLYVVMSGDVAGTQGSFMPCDAADKKGQAERRKQGEQRRAEAAKEAEQAKKKESKRKTTSP